MAQCTHPDDGPPVLQLFVRREELAYLVTSMGVADDHVEDSAGEIHDAEAVLEAAVGGTRIDEVGERELMDVSETLESARVNDFSLLRGDPDERMNRIADLMLVLRRRHGRIVMTIQSGAPDFYFV